MPLIKRYPNRKLYNTEAKRYVTLDDITEMIRDDEDIHVIDHESGDDLTTLTLTQIILEQEKKTTGFLPRSLLTSLIRTGGDTVEQIVRSLQGAVGALEEATQAEGQAPKKADKQAKGADEPGDLTADEPADASPPKRIVPPTLTSVDERISDVLHMLNVPTHRDMRKLQEQLDLLSEQLGRLASTPVVSQPAPTQDEPNADEGQGQVRS